MKIAMLVVGEPRTILECAKYNKNLIDPKHQIDYFLHIWNTETILHPATKIIHLDDETKAQILRLYKPMVYNFPTPFSWNDIRERIFHLPFKSYDVHGPLSKMWANYEANNMRLGWERITGQKYDAIIFIRTDLIFDMQWFDPEPFLLDPKQVVLSSWQNFGAWGDMFMIAKDQAATYYSHMILWLAAHGPLAKDDVDKREWAVERWMTTGNYTKVEVPIPMKVMRRRHVGLPFHAIPTHPWV